MTCQCARQDRVKTLCGRPVSPAMIDLLVSIAQTVIVCAPATASTNPIPPLRKFVADLVASTRIQTSAFLTTLCYVARLRRKLPATARGLACTVHRIVLASMLLAMKFLYDAPIRNRAYASVATAFSLAEVNLMEKQLLALLDYRLTTSPDEIAMLL
ncbi:hypothetical protein BC832DRAFT_529992, partial [Gaertneriomyces semiglobifer]